MCIRDRVTAVNFATGPERRLLACSELLQGSINARQDEAVAFALATRALILSELVAAEPSRTLEAFDAAQTAFQNCAAAQQREALGSIFAKALAVNPDLAVFRRWWMALFGSRDGVAPEQIVDLEEARESLPILWDVEPGDLRGRLLVLPSLYIDVENARLRLEPRQPLEFLESSWTTWSVNNPVYHRAIPHGTSLLRERYLHQLLLVLNHELVHIYSMASGVGAAVIALRAAVLKTEINLWTLGSHEPAQAIVQHLFESGVAPLAGGGVMAVSYTHLTLPTICSV